MVTQKTSSTQKTKEKFDTEAFVFETDLDLIQESLDRLWKQEEDPLAFPLTKDEIYYLGWWDLNMPLFRKYNQKTALICAKESAVLQLYKPKPKAKATTKAKTTKSTKTVKIVKRK